eukprot:TRINITY_DN11674_c0_g1_i1.p1 TRINITY_DN11674_c0_g1~~TRINITY_DN11674_c0_g1_i1.p1  ORF type:complete len:487 (+),score=123.87 TRINITY_DN11674_c0_g1_i1:51-1511(+)
MNKSKNRGYSAKRPVSKKKGRFPPKPARKGSEFSFQFTEKKAIDGFFRFMCASDKKSISVNGLFLVFEEIGRHKEEVIIILEKMYPELKTKYDENPDKANEIFLTQEQYNTVMSERTVELFTDAELVHPRVEDLCKILDAYREQCVQRGKFMVAASLKDQIKSLQKRERRRQETALVQRQKDEQNTIEQLCQEEMMNIGAKWELAMQEYKQNGERMLLELESQQKAEMDELHATLSTSLKEKLDGPFEKFASNQLLNLLKRRDFYSKSENYREAQKAQNQAQALQTKETSIFKSKQMKQNNQKMDNLRKKHKQQIHVMKSRIGMGFREFSRERDEEVERVLLQARNQRRAHSNRHKLEKNERKKVLQHPLALTQTSQLSRMLSPRFEHSSPKKGTEEEEEQSNSTLESDSLAPEPLESESMTSTSLEGTTTNEDLSNSIPLYNTTSSSSSPSSSSNQECTSETKPEDEIEDDEFKKFQPTTTPQNN